MRILETGVGTGRYSHCFAQKEYEVDAVNLKNIVSDQYDITLLLGPMYHLYTDEDRTGEKRFDNEYGGTAAEYQ